MADRILLIDGLNYIYRGNIAFKSSGSSQEQPIEAKPSFPVVYNFFRNLRVTIEEFAPSKVFFVLEGANNFRYGLYPEYKANRILKKASAPEKQEVFDRQRDVIIRLLQYLPITVASADTFEADDTIFTLAKNLANENVVIVSSDKDFTQIKQLCGRDNVSLYNPIRKQTIQPPAYHFATFLALAGDTSDNIPSLVSEAKAIKYASNPSELLGFLSSEENRANYNLNLQLVLLREFDIDKLSVIVGHTDFAALRQEFIAMDFKRIVEEKYWKRFTDTFASIN